MSEVATLTQLGPYRIVREVARGTMGVVYEGHDPREDRAVAVKVALSQALRDPDKGARFREIFFKEAHTAGQLRHPNILEVLDAGVDGDTCFIVSEFIPGGRTLRDYCRAPEPLPVARVLAIIGACAAALVHAQEAGVIHRDVKPSNILLSDDDQVKLADFSIAHLMQVDTADTLPMGFVGSPRYMAPEQILEEALDHRADLFSLAVIAFELLAGCHPFGGDSFSSLVYRVVNEPPQPLRDSRPELPPAVDELLARALAKDPEQRFASADAFHAALSELLGPMAEPAPAAPTLADRLAELPGVAELSGAERLALERAGMLTSRAAGDTLARAGEPEASLFLLLTGEVGLERAEESILTLRPGDWFGALSAAPGAVQWADARVLVDAEVLSLSAATVSGLQPALRLHLAQLCQRALSRYLKTVAGRSLLAALAPDNVPTPQEPRPYP